MRLLSYAFMLVLFAAHADAQTADKPQEKTYEAKGSTGGSRGGSKDSTHIDFEATLLEGKMKAPAGTFLQGRKIQDKAQMVNLRTLFRRELKRSKGGVAAQAN